MVTNRWKPDFCGCSITFTFDDDLPLEERVEVAKDIEVACEHHQSTKANPRAHRQALLDECRIKENAREEVRKALDLKDAPDWKHDKDRNVVIVIPKEKRDRIPAMASVIAPFNKVRVE